MAYAFFVRGNKKLSMRKSDRPKTKNKMLGEQLGLESLKGK